jgi:hypothetical protein
LTKTYFLVTGTECFSDSKSTVVAQSRICEGVAANLLTPDANLFFSNVSVIVDCADVLLSSVAGNLSVTRYHKLIHYSLKLQDSRYRQIIW